MYNKLAVGLCCLTLLAVAADFALLRTPIIHAQNTTVHVEEVRLSIGAGELRASGQTIVGFACADAGNSPHCFIASK